MRRTAPTPRAPLTRTLLQNLEVLSAGQDFKKDAEGKPVVVQVINLLATPEQAEELSLAASQTQIQLVLRNPLDRVAVNTPGTTLSQIFSGRKTPLAAVIDPAPAPRRAPRPAPPQVVHTVRAAQEGSAFCDGDHLGDQENRKQVRG